jgi:glyoxylase I family protein
MIRRFNHVALRCKDAVETVEFYTKAMGFRFAQSFQNDHVPSMGGLYCPHLHVFFELEDGSAMAFFEIPTLPPSVPDPNTPVWSQHIAFDVADDESLINGMQRVEGFGVKTTGLIDHGVGHSVYFNDPSGYRLELVHWLDSSVAGHDRLMAEAQPCLDRWMERKLKGFGDLKKVS